MIQLFRLRVTSYDPTDGIVDPALGSMYFAKLGNWGGGGLSGQCHFCCFWGINLYWPFEHCSPGMASQPGLCPAG